MAGPFPGLGSYEPTPEEEMMYRRRRNERTGGYGLSDAMGGMDGVGNPLADSLNFQPEPFYSPDTGITRSGYDYIGDLGAALLAGSGYRAGPADFGSNLGQAAQQANASYSQRLRQQVNDRVTNYGLKRQQRQDALEEQERQRQAAAQEQQQQLLGQLGPEYQTLAALGEGPAAQALKAQLFPDPVKPEYRTIGNQLYEVNPGQQPKLVASAPNAPREDPLVAVQTPEGPKLLPRSQAVGMAPATAQGADPLVEVYDETSPTKTKFVPRSQAAGMPGKPGGAGITLYDPETGKPIAQVGGPGGMPKAPSGYQYEGMADPAAAAAPMPTASAGPMVPGVNLPGADSALIGGKAPGLTATPGGPADRVTPAEAGSYAGRAVGADALGTLRDKLIGPDGKPDRVMLGMMEGNIPFTDGRTANQAMAEAVETKLRALTGAAATEAETARLIEMTKPSLLDTDEAIKLKLERMQKFLSLSGSRNFSDIVSEIGGGGRRESTTGDAYPAVSSAAERDALPPGTRYRAPDGSIRTR